MDVRPVYSYYSFVSVACAGPLGVCPIFGPVSHRLNRPDRLTSHPQSVYNLLNCISLLLIHRKQQCLRGSYLLWRHYQPHRRFLPNAHLRLPHLHVWGFFCCCRLGGRGFDFGAFQGDVFRPWNLTKRDSEFPRSAVTWCVSIDCGSVLKVAQANAQWEGFPLCVTGTQTQFVFIEERGKEWEEVRENN